MTPKMALKCVALLAVGLLAAQVYAEEVPVLKTQNDKVNYGIGVNVVKNFKQQGIEIDLDVVIKGMKDALSGGKLLMTEEDLRKTMMAFQNELRLKQRQTRTAGVNNKKDGEMFLAENKKKEGVVSLPSGLQYNILKAGDGKKPTEADIVECRYRGTLIDGTEFDSSDVGGKPATFKVAGVIPGWTEALKLMPVGSRWQLFIPPHLAYGARGAGRIGPNATIIFELELLNIK
jgi:FKBP-type peptidyl-prolyl cis-trans isomerase FklB